MSRHSPRDESHHRVEKQARRLCSSVTLADFREHARMQYGWRVHQASPSKRGKARAALAESTALEEEQVVVVVVIVHKGWQMLAKCA